MQFSVEQEYAFQLYKRRQNMFITGPGGCGKTALIRHIYADAVQQGIGIQVCALTGCAAMLLECKAKTVHSWSGIGLGKGSIADIVAKLSLHHFAKSNWMKTRILIIDEVSMMSCKLFETLDAIGKAIRRNHLPFGGIQLIFSGDFYQLPPVGDKDEPETGQFCFESPLWFSTFSLSNHIVFHRIFRQADEQYQSILNQIREGRLKRRSNDVLVALMQKQWDPCSTIHPTKLFPTRNKVDAVNMAEMAKLHVEEHNFELTYVFDGDTTAKDKARRQQFSPQQVNAELLYLKGNLRCETDLVLKVGCQVMCIVNMELPDGHLLCNGAQGIVTDFCKLGGHPIVTYQNGTVMTMVPHFWKSETIPGIGVKQIPLVLSWAMTIHKAQGSTLDMAEIDAGSGIFECGQTYVALSRVKDLNGLYLSSFDASRIRINLRVQSFYSTLPLTTTPNPNASAKTVSLSPFVVANQIRIQKQQEEQQKQQQTSDDVEQNIDDVEQDIVEEKMMEY